MAKQLRTTTNYQFNRLEELQRVVAKAITPKQTFRQRAVMLGAGGVSAGCGLVLLMMFDLLIPAILCLAIGLFLLTWGVFFYPLRAWTAGRAMGGKQRIVNEFVLEKANILVYLGESSARYPYTDCSRLLEAELALYVILKDGKGLMLDKENIKGGSADDLRAWLEEKCGVKTEWMGRAKQG